MNDLYYTIKIIECGRDFYTDNRQNIMFTTITTILLYYVSSLQMFRIVFYDLYNIFYFIARLILLILLL